MTLSELKTGMMVVLRNHNGYIVIKDAFFEHPDQHHILWRTGGYWLPLGIYDENLNCTIPDLKEMDIMEVYMASSPSFIFHPFGTSNTLIWSRQEET
jgi:hypothetical protein